MRLKKVEKHIVLIVLLALIAVCCTSCIVYYSTLNKYTPPLVKKYGYELPYKAMLVSQNLKSIILNGNIDDEDLAIKLDEKQLTLADKLSIENDENVEIIYMQNDSLLDNEIVVKQYGARCFYKYDDISLDIYIPHDITLVDGKLKVVKGSFLPVAEHNKVIAEHSRLLKNFSDQQIHSGYLAQSSVDFPIIVIYSK